MSALQTGPRSVDVVDLQLDEPEPTDEQPSAAKKRSPRRVAGTVLVILGCVVALLLVFEFLLSNLVYDRSQALLLRDLRSLVVTEQATSLSWVPEAGQPVGVLSIPRIGLSTVIVQGTTSSLTRQGPGHLRGTPLPGRVGNSVIMGRRTTFGAPFKRLPELLPGDTVQVSTGAGLFTYVVAAVSVVRPGDVDVIGTSTDNRLTLVTSSPAFLASGRYVVTAALRGLPARQPVGPEVFVAPSELGVVGEAGALGGLVLWGELAIIAVLGGVWLARRASSHVAWLLAAPLVLALLWASFLAVDRFFPPTL